MTESRWELAIVALMSTVVFFSAWHVALRLLG
jgi:hypothetical protein